MLIAFTCDGNIPFGGVCDAISGHDPTGVAGPLVQRLIGSVGVFVIIYLGGRVVRRVSDAGMRRAGADRQVQTLLHNVITVVTLIAAVLSALVVTGVNIGVLLTAAGVGTIAIGLAFQDVLRNILAGIWLLLERPFRLGDNISVGDQSGVVENITLRTTTLRTGDGRLAVLPNLTAFSSPVINASSYAMRQFTVSVRQPAEANLEAAMREAREALTSVEAIAAAPAPSIVPQLDGEWALLHCRYWIDQKHNDPDAVAAEVAARVWKIGRSG
jgi:small conductance mechanosensitive channel